MFIDHSGAFFFPDAQWLRGIGRGAAPIFLFLGGYAASYRFKPYLLLLAVAMSLSDYCLVGHLRLQNILYSIIACRLLFDWMEKHGKRIERPFEWYVSSLALLSSLFIVQYGTLGLMFAVGGYIQRRPEHYSDAQRRLYLRLSFATYAGLEIWLSSFTLLPALLTLASVYGVYRLLLTTDTRPVTANLPHWLMRLAKMFSYYSATIYALHLIALEWLTGTPF